MKDNGWMLPDEIDPENNRCACIPVPDDLNHIRAFWGALYELGYQFNWQRDAAHKALPTSIKWMSIVRAAHEKWLEGVMCGTCEEFTECLQPLYDAVTALQTSINAQTAMLEAQSEILEALKDANTVSAPTPPAAVCTEANIYPGALEVVRRMNQENNRLYDAAEISNADNAAEVAAFIVSAIPGFGLLPFDELAALANWYFGNQVDDYQAAYTLDFETAAAYSLMCYIVANDCVFDYATWDLWLQNLQDFCDLYITDGSADVAIGLYMRFAPSAQTLANLVALAYKASEGQQIQFLIEYFEDLYRSYAVMAESTLTPPSGYDCPEPPSTLVPIINTDDWIVSGGAGGAITDMGGGYWKVATGAGNALTIKDAAGQPFIIADPTYVGITPQCNWYEYEAGNVQVFDGCTGSPAYTGAAVYNFGKTFIVYTEMTFRMDAP